MPITEPEWLSVRTMIEKVVRRIAGTRADYFVTGKVIKVDAKNKCVYLKEFGDQPIPIVAFNQEVKYYDSTITSTSVRTAPVKIVMPKVGESVLVAREMGVRRLPRCLGVIQGTNWVVPEAE